MIKKSFPLRVTALTFILLALPLLIYSFIFFHNTYNQSLIREKVKLKEVAELRAFGLAGIFPVKPFLLSETIYFLDLENQDIDANSEKISRQLKEVSDIAGAIDFFIVQDSANSYFPVIASSIPELLGTSLISFVQMNDIIRNGEGTFFRYIYHPIEKKFVPTIFMCKVIPNKGKNTQLSVLITVYIIENELKQILSKTERRAEINYAILTNEDLVMAATDPRLVGNFFAHISKQRRSQIEETGKLGEIKLAEKALPVIQGSEPSTFEFVFDDQVQMAHRSEVPNMSASFLVYTSKKTFFVRAIRHFLVIYMTYGLLLILGAAVTFWLTRLISRPLSQLSYLMGKVSQGHLDVRFNKQPLGFEINVLGDIFNDTLDKLFANIQQAEDERVTKEKYRKELEIARSIQNTLMPNQMPQIPGIEIAANFLPSQNVNSDFYTFFSKKSSNSEQEVVFGVVDVAGQGISSCLYSLTLRSLINTHSTLSDDIGQILSHVNNAFVEDVGDSGMFATILMGILNLATKKFNYYSCGHVPGIVRKETGQVIYLEHTGLAIGLLPSTGYQPSTIQLEKGDLVLFYTDGLTEAINDKQQHFSKRKLHALLQQRKWITAQEWAEGMTQEIRAYTGGAAQDDDVAFVFMRITE